MNEATVQFLSNEILPLVLQALGILLTTLVGWLGMKASRWLEAKTHSASFSCAVEKITTVTKMLVAEAERTLVKEAQAAAADGKLTKEEGLKIRNEVVKRAKEHLGTKGLKELQGCLGHAGDDGMAMIERMLRTHVEARLAEMKNAA